MPNEFHPEYAINIRVTGVLIRDNRLLLVRQRVDKGRSWSLPGGHLETGEAIGEAAAREILEETGIEANVDRLLYVSDFPERTPPIVHFMLQMNYLGGEERLPTNEHDDNTITAVRFVPIEELTDYGFTYKFSELVRSGFPDTGQYVGHKRNIGL